LADQVNKLSHANTDEQNAQQETTRKK